jgi:hypothetical protein
MSNLLLNLLYGSLPSPTFQLPDGRLQPDFLMDVVPDFLFFLVSFGMVFGLSLYCYHQENNILLSCSILPVMVHWVLYFAHGKVDSNKMLH